MLQKIKSGDFYIYTNEIIHPKEFSKIYNKEDILKEFETNVTTLTHHPFATFLAKDRHATSNIKVGDVLILRAVKSNKKFEFVSKICKWGRFSIPKIVIKILNIKNHEKVGFEIIEESKKREIKEEGIINLKNIEEDVKIIYRKNDFITVFREYKTPITLPRFIKITPELVELCFLIHGDGHYKNKLYFVNKNSELHRFVINKFDEIFRIPKTTWRVRLLLNRPSDSESAKENWKKTLNLKEEQFYPSVSRCVLKTSNLGNLRIVIDKTIVSIIFRHVFNKLVNLNEKLSLYALNGLLYAEGGARKDKQGLHKITLSFNQEEKKLFKNILQNTNILELTRIEQNKRFCMSGWENQYEFFKIFFLNNIVPFSIHTERCKKALGGFLKHNFTKTMCKYLNILNKKPNSTIKELVSEMKHLPNSILKSLRRSQYAKFIKIEGRGVNRNPFRFSITPEGKAFLNLIQNIREVYNEKCKLKKNQETENYQRTA